MDEIKEHIVGILKNDATLQSYTGYTASDPRIYEWYPAFTPTLNTTYPGYIVYRTASWGRPSEYVDRAQKGDIFMHFDVMAYDSDHKGYISRRIDDLLDLYGSFSTTNYRVLQLQIEEDFELPMEGESTTDRRYRHHITVRLIGVLRLTPIGNVT